MAEHNELGKTGEEIAVEYILRQGFKILYRNWRFMHKEIDIIALDGRTLVFIEVKTRSGNIEARDTMSASKMRYLSTAANFFIDRFKRTEEARFDLIVIRFLRGQYTVEHIKEAFR